MARYLLAIDQGTTGSTALVMGTDSRTLGRETVESQQHFTEPARVEHDPAESVEPVQGALQAASLRGADTAAISITNRRETTFSRHRASGRPIHRVIIWQARCPTDVASRTSSMNRAALARDDRLCEPYRVPTKLLPKILGSTGETARTRGFAALSDGIPITGVAGDQQAALFGEACFEPRDALEGICLVAGATVQWLPDGLGSIRSSKEVEALARKVSSSDRVDAIRDAVEASALEPDTLPSAQKHPPAKAPAVRQTAKGESSAPTGRIPSVGLSLTRIRVDGGAAENNLLMQFHSDVSDLCIERPLELESTARGDAMLAGVGAGMFSGVSQAAGMVEHPERFEPQMTRSMREQHLCTWRAALGRARSSRPEHIGASEPPGGHRTRLESHGN